MKILRRKRNQQQIPSIQVWDDHTERLLTDYLIQTNLR